MKPAMFDAIRQGFGDNVMNYYRHMRANDTFATYTVLPPQGARKPEMYARAGMKVPTLRVVDETDDGVVIDGMKMPGTSAVFCNETWVENLPPMGPDHIKESTNCALPQKEEGVETRAR